MVNSDSITIVLPRSNGYVYICLFVSIGIKTFWWHIQKSGVVLKIICCQLRGIKIEEVFGTCMQDISFLLLLFLINGLSEHLDNIEAPKGYLGICNSNISFRKSFKLARKHVKTKKKLNVDGIE